VWVEVAGLGPSKPRARGSSLFPALGATLFNPSFVFLIASMVRLVGRRARLQTALLDGQRDE